MSNEERMDVIDQLAVNPESGILLGDGLPKVRIAKRSGGKSGGYRALYFHRSPDMPLFPLMIFAKNEKANINRSEKTDLIKLCNLIEETYRAKS